MIGREYLHAASHVTMVTKHDEEIVINQNLHMVGWDVLDHIQMLLLDVMLSPVRVSDTYIC